MNENRLKKHEEVNDISCFSMETMLYFAMAKKIHTKVEIVVRCTCLLCEAVIVDPFGGQTK